MKANMLKAKIGPSHEPRSMEGASKRGAGRVGKKKRPGRQPETIRRRVPSETALCLLLVDRCRAAEECLDSFIDVAAESCAR